MVTTAQDVAEMAKQAGMKKGQVLLKVEDFRGVAAEKHTQANEAQGKGLYRLAAEKESEMRHMYELADLYDAAARLM